MGTLAVCEASHRLPEFARLRETYGKMDWEKDRLDGSGWFTDDPAEITRLFGGQVRHSDRISPKIGRICVASIPRIRDCSSYKTTCCHSCMCAQWKTADFKAGDLLLFGMATVHMSTPNTTQHVRISADVRWQPATEPIDKRYVGDFGAAAPILTYTADAVSRCTFTLYHTPYGTGDTHRSHIRSLPQIRRCTNRTCYSTAVGTICTSALRPKID